MEVEELPDASPVHEVKMYLVPEAPGTTVEVTLAYVVLSLSCQPVPFVLPYADITVR